MPDNQKQPEHILTYWIRNLVGNSPIFSIRNIAENDTEHNFPKVFTSRSGNLTLMIFDMSIIVGLAIFIHIDFLNYFFFRFLQTVLFPLLMLFMLRFIYILQAGNMNDKLEG